MGVLRLKEALTIVPISKLVDFEGHDFGDGGVTQVLVYFIFQISFSHIN